MRKKFTVDYVGNMGRKVYVLATQSDDREFRVTDFSYLNNVHIEKSLTMPRKLKKEDGTIDMDTYGFVLRFKNDKEKFRVGEVVELEEERLAEPGSSHNVGKRSPL